MTSKATVINYVSPPTGSQFNAAGDFLLYVNSFYTDTADPAKIFYNQPLIALPPLSPTSWAGLIRQALVQNGIDNGFTDLTTNAVSILDWTPSYTQQLRLGATLTNVGVSPQALATFSPLESGFLNLADRRMSLRGTVAYSTGALETPIVNLAFEIDDGVDVLGLIYISSLAVGGSNNDSPIRFDFNVVCDTPGTSAVLVGTGDMSVTSLGVTTFRNMLPDWLSTNQISLTGPITPRLMLSASSNMASAHLVEAFLEIE